MRKLLQPIIIVSLGVLAATGGALAQNDPGLDLEAIRARAAAGTEEAEALAAQARERAKAVTEEARTSAEHGKANGRSYAEQARAESPDSARMFDFDRMVADAGEMAKAGMGEAPRFIAFASLSMPADALRQMMNDVTKAGGVVVLRGLTQGSAKVMTDALAKVLAPGERMDGVGIDPRLFRAFGIETVPAYVVAGSDFDLCDGLDCETNVPPYDRLSGNVTAGYALATIAGGQGPGALIARQHLSRLEREEP